VYRLGEQYPSAGWREAAARREKLLIGGLVLPEVPQGARDEANAARIGSGSRVALLDAKLAARLPAIIERREGYSMSR
jgi:hypothetical protein